MNVGASLGDSYEDTLSSISIVPNDYPNDGLDNVVAIMPQTSSRGCPPQDALPLADIVATGLGMGDSDMDKKFREFLHGLEKVFHNY